MTSRPMTRPFGARRGPGGNGARAGADSARKQAARERLITLSRLLDAAFEVPGLRTRAGLDALLGLVPGVGDVVSAAIGLYLVAEARHLGASRWLQARMVGNLLVDAAVGAIPVAGDLFDVYFKAHLRNLELLRRELGEPWIEGAVARGADAIDVDASAGPPAGRR